MKPESPTAYQGSEAAPSRERVSSPKQGVELVGPDVGIEKGAEQFESRAESSAIATELKPASTLPTPVVDNQAADDNTTSTTAPTTTDSPMAAGDDDLIEKEWVDKAKKIVADTKNDPYMREERVSDLRGDYRSKRFGRELGAAD